MKRTVLILAVLLTVSAVVFAGGGKERTPPGVLSTGTSITVEVFDRGTDGGRSLAHNNAWTNWIKEKVKRDIGIDVTFVPVGRWSENTDIVNLMASGSAPDLCYTYGGDMIAAFRDQGGILNLTPYIDSHLPDLKKLLGADPAFTGKDFIYRNADPQTGHIYSIPSYRIAIAQRNVFIRKDWLDKLGLPVPKTIQEFENALIAFRDKDPGNVGKNRVVPLAVNEDTRWGLADFIHHHINNLNDRDRWVYNIADRYIMMPGYKEGVRLMNKWYNDKLIYNEFPLMFTADDLYNQMKSGVVGAFCQNWDLPYRQDYKINEELAANVPGAEFVAVDLNLKNKDMMDKVGLQIFIPAYAKNQEGALKYLNWLAKPENYGFLQIGREGVNHRIEDGIPRIISPSAGDPWFQNSPQNIDYTMPINGVELGSVEKNGRALAQSYGNTPADAVVNAYTISLRNARAPAVYQATTTINQYSQDLREKADDLLVQAISAPAANFNRIWDNGIREWRTSGAQAVYDERAKLYRR